jgi:Protein of unknown function (DUF2939)
MRHTIRVIVVLALLWIGYLAWPVYGLFVLIRAVETRDVGAVTNIVYFDAVRVSLTNQVVDAYLRHAQIEIGPLRRNIAAAAIANPVVERLVSAEAVSQLLSAGWPTPILPAPPGTMGITTDTIGTIWQVFANSQYGFGRFEVAAPAGLPRQRRFRLQFRLLQWRWRLVGIIVPEHIVNLLADELAKAVQK